MEQQFQVVAALDQLLRCEFGIIHDLGENKRAFKSRQQMIRDLVVLDRYPWRVEKSHLIVDCFRQGGGVGYEHYPRFHKVMAEDSGQTVLAAFEEHILPLVSQLIPRLKAGIRVLDVGCGKGVLLLWLAEHYPNSEFVGYDLSQQALAEARTIANNSHLANIQFEERDLTGFAEQAESGAFDWVSAFDAIHDQATPQSVLDGIYKTLKRDGVFLMQDIRASSHLENNLEHPIAPLLYTLSTMHCMTVSLAQDGAGLGNMWGKNLPLRCCTPLGLPVWRSTSLITIFKITFT